MTKTMKFKTSINCNGCLSKVTPTINKIDGIIEWSVDLADKDKILTVVAENVEAIEIIQKISQTGFVAEEII
jgi:copper chaperone